MGKPYFAGIDPGLSGAIAVIDSAGQFVWVEDMPTLLRGKGAVKREVDAAGIAHLLRPIADQIRLFMVEKVSAMPAQGSASTFSLGHSLGTAVAVVQTLGIPVELVSPATWKKRMGLTRDKEDARAKAIHLWPTAPLHLKRHADRSEALLLARYALTL